MSTRRTQTKPCRSRRVEFLDFMDQLVALHPCKELHVVLDNLSTHLVEKEKWAKQHARVHCSGRALFQTVSLVYHRDLFMTSGRANRAG